MRLPLKLRLFLAKHRKTMTTLVFTLTLSAMSVAFAATTTSFQSSGDLLISLDSVATPTPTTGSATTPTPTTTDNSEPENTPAPNTPTIGVTFKYLEMTTATFIGAGHGNPDQDPSSTEDTLVYYGTNGNDIILRESGEYYMTKYSTIEWPPEEHSGISGHWLRIYWLPDEGIFSHLPPIDKSISPPSIGFIDGSYNYVGEWVAGTAYQQNQVVLDTDGRYYMAKWYATSIPHEKSAMYDEWQPLHWDGTSFSTIAF